MSIESPKELRDLRGLEGSWQPRRQWLNSEWFVANGYLE